ncbi:MAG TPA: TIGR01457 family HAD-type hydrolase [Atopostipes sp.]|nr:TIGR01457 family HAD-type hydrolase [Atopostipes sp.]
MHKDYAGYLIDLDGTMYNGNESIAEAAGFIERLRKTNKPFLFLTNNSTSNPEDVSKKLKQVSDVEAYPKEVFTSTEATISYLHKRQLKRIYVIGEAGLMEGLMQEDFVLTDEAVDAVVVGLDSQVDYAKLEQATLLIQAGAEFIGTNPDTNLPTERGLIPGNGALIAFLEAATGQQATIVGKPEAIIMEEALDKLGLKKEEVLMVGDNYTTDIQAGIRNGIDTLLVLTGFTHKNDVPNLPTPATYVVDTLDEWEV